MVQVNTKREDLTASFGFSRPSAKAHAADVQFRDRQLVSAVAQA